MTNRHERRAAKKRKRKILNRRSFGEVFDRMNCLDCGVNVVAVGDYYMVNKDVWERLGLSWLDNLCIPCLEQRLGHELVGSEEIAPNQHRCDNPDRGLMSPHSLPGRGFRFSRLYTERMMRDRYFGWSVNVVSLIAGAS
jgi:hypothetical protein